MTNKAPKTLAVGGEGSGKTFLQLHYSRREKWLVILDLNDQPDLGQGAHVVRCKADFLDAMRAMYREKQRARPYRVTWHVGRKEDARAVLDFVIRAIRKIGGAALFLDESESFIPVLNKMTPEVFELAKRARHGGAIPLYMTAQSPMELHRKIRNNLSKTMYFYAENQATLNFLQKEKALYHSKADISKLLLSLKKHEFLLDEFGKPLKKMRKIRMS